MNEGGPKDLGLLRLLTWTSPSFPTGGFAYSQGLEWAVEAGDVRDGASLLSWVEDALACGGLRNDAILLRHAHRGGLAALAELNAFACANAGCKERLAETQAQGTAFAAAAGPWLTADLARTFEGIGALALPIAVGAVGAANALPEATCVLAFLHGAAANLVSAGLRLIPLGQSAGLAVQAALEGRILDCAAATDGAALEDIGGACLRADIAAMRHETQYTRLFRS